MLTISNSFNISKSSKIQNKDFIFPKKNRLQTDVFYKSNDISFKGIQGLFKRTSDSLPQIEVLPRVNVDFASRITKQISKFPAEWLRRFKNNNYRIILTPNFSEAYKSQKVFDPNIENFEMVNPQGTLGITYSEGRFGKNFFAFCDKPPYSDIYMESIVNHELSHGIVNILGLDKNPKILELLKKDVELIIKDRKLDELNPNERRLISHYFFNNQAYLPIDEIVADVLAWNKSAGCYGSGLVMGINNPNLMKNLFPNLSNYLRTI